jgi:hypothetical protein
MDITAILNGVVSHALASGLFETVNQHEPKSAPGNGLTAAVWAQEIAPVATGSGLAATSGRVEFWLRIYTNMLSEPQDAIDPNVLTAVDTLMTAYSADFTLGDQVKDIDLLGEHGTPLSAKAGYLNQDGKLYRVMDIVLPLIINDIWAQSP